MIEMHLCYIGLFIYPIMSIDEILVDFAHCNPLYAFVFVYMFNDPDIQLAAGRAIERDIFSRRTFLA